MKKLFLVRHAKSSWEEEGLLDIDRPLKGRGVRDAYSAARWLAEQGESADHLFSSPATRALHTALVFSRELGYPFSDISIVQELYDCTATDIELVARAIPDHFNSAMIFGHNPGMTNFLNRCIDHRIDKLPTTGIACLSFEIDHWAHIDGQAELLFFDYPKRRQSK